MSEPLTTIVDNLDEVLTELYEDLMLACDSPFDQIIAEAIEKRGCTYVECYQPVAN